MTSPQRFYKSLHFGAAAPRFSLPAFPGGGAALTDYVGKYNVLLFFYSRDFIGNHDLNGICGNAAISLCALSADASEFRQANTKILAVSRDSLTSHERLADLLELQIPLLSDESGDVGEWYGLLPENRWAGSSDSYDIYNCAVIVDAKGQVRHRQTANVILSPTLPMPAALQQRFAADLRLWLGRPTALHTANLLWVVRSLDPLN
jgi:thioredoxin-dependent peroxiredoxin